MKLTKNGFPQPLEAKCFQCQKSFLVKYVVPRKAYSKKNNGEYGTNPQAQSPHYGTDKKKRSKDRQICNACLLDFYYDKETYWETMKDLKKRQKLRTYIHEGRFAL